MTLTGTYSDTAAITFDISSISTTLSESVDDTQDTLIGSFAVTVRVGTFDSLSIYVFADSQYVTSGNKFKGLAQDSSGTSYTFLLKSNKDANGDTNELELSHNLLFMSNYSTPPSFLQTHTISIYTVSNQTADLYNTSYYLKLKFRIEGL